MAVEESIVADLVRDEGEVLAVYRDSLGYLTIGVGHLVDPRRGGRISRAASRFILAEDIAEMAADLDRELPWWRGLDEVRQRVLLNMAFNLGIAGLLKFTNTLAAVEDGRWTDAAKGMRASKWARQVGDRSRRLAEMMRTGKEE